ncbi:MAG: hypothetical protein JXK07_10725 [Spirochaetes bacterium]|nr:hypothetical protein [Spirochaetota bacterium]MBN2769260.1 hypothetical protein [Spirochaetota bacterium]
MNIFILSVQFEGEDALEAFGDITRTLRQNLKKLQSGNYTDDLKKLKIYLGVGGSLGDFVEPNGCHAVTIHGETCIVDVVMHKEIWEKGKKSIVHFLADQVKRAFVKIVNTMKADNLMIRDERLLKDVNRAVDLWLKNYL